jgi:hypothetical protein
LLLFFFFFCFLLEAFVALLQFQTLKSIAHKKNNNKNSSSQSEQSKQQQLALLTKVFLFLIGSKAQELESKTGVQNWGPELWLLKVLIRFFKVHKL